MTVPAPPPPDRDGPRALTPRERALLARIETDLAEADPALAHDLATRRPPVIGLRPPVTKVQAGLLALIMVVLSGATQLPESLWWPVLPVLTLLLVVPWLVHCVRRPATD